MFEISASASDAIAREQEARGLPVTGGVRIYQRPEPDEVRGRNLAVAFVAEPRQGDAVFHRGSAVVFVDRQIGDFVESRILDVDGTGESPPKLVLRRQQHAQ
jgi:Fe-S cluster assembly iron-binding protein IscA